MKRFTVAAMMFCLLLGSVVAFAQQDEEKTRVSEDGLDKMLAPAPKAAAEGAKPAATDIAQAEEQTFPPDARKMYAKIVLADGKTVKGRVLNFLEGLPQPDMLAAPEWQQSEGPVVQFGTDEFVLDWKDVKVISYDKKFKENGEVSCVENMDASPDRRECTMYNQYIITSRAKKAKGKGLIASRNAFRIVLEGKGGKPGVVVDTFLGRMRFTNQRDETRNAGKLAQELKEQKEKNVKSITLSK